MRILFCDINKEKLIGVIFLGLRKNCFFNYWRMYGLVCGEYVCNDDENFLFVNKNWCKDVVFEIVCVFCLIGYYMLNSL